MKSQDPRSNPILNQIHNLIRACKDCEKEIEEIKRNHLFLYQDALDVFNEQLCEDLGYHGLPRWARQWWKKYRKANSSQHVAEVLLDLKSRNWSLFDFINLAIAHTGTPPLPLMQHLLWN